MLSLEPKKLVIIRILQILEHYTDCDHPLKHDEIVQKLDSEYGITIERKAVGRNIALLIDAGYDIVTTAKGAYLASRTFEDAELRLLCDSVLSSRHITANHSKELIEKLSSLSNKYFASHIKNVYSVNDWSKSDNVALFYNVEVVDEAIEKKKKISFDYNKYGADKKLHRSASHVVSPYQMILHNQRYYLMAHHDRHNDVGYYRLDRITDIRMTDDPAVELRSLDGYRSGIDYKKFSSALPYMFSDELEQITFIIDDEGLIDQIVDWFGYGFDIRKTEGGYSITVKASPQAMEYWAMQYLNGVEIVSPKSLRDKIAQNIKAATAKYSE